MAIKNGDECAMRELWRLYEKQYKIDPVEKYYLVAMENCADDAMRFLGNLYEKLGKFDLASETAFGRKILSYGNRRTR